MLCRRICRPCATAAPFTLCMDSQRRRPLSAMMCMSSRRMWMDGRFAGFDWRPGRSGWRQGLVFRMWLGKAPLPLSGDESCAPARHESYDIVHLHSVFLWPTLCAARIAERARVPYCWRPEACSWPTSSTRKAGCSNRVDQAVRAPHDRARRSPACDGADRSR